MWRIVWNPIPNVHAFVLITANWQICIWLAENGVLIVQRATVFLPKECYNVKDTSNYAAACVVWKGTLFSRGMEAQFERD